MNANTKITEQKLTEAFWHDYQDLTFGQILELVQDAMSAAEKKAHEIRTARRPGPKSKIEDPSGARSHQDPPQRVLQTGGRMNEKIIVSSFPQFQKLSRTKLLAETATVEIAGNQIIIAAADRPTLISVLNGIAPDVDWSAEESNPITIAFLKLHPRHPCSS